MWLHFSRLSLRETSDWAHCFRMQMHLKWMSGLTGVLSGLSSFAEKLFESTYLIGSR